MPFSIPLVPTDPLALENQWSFESNGAMRYFKVF